MVNHLHIKSLSSPVCYQVLLYTYWPGTADMARDEPDSLSDVFNFGKFKRGLKYGFKKRCLKNALCESFSSFETL